MHNIHIIDSHTGGEPTRVVTAGFPPLQGTTIAEKRKSFEQHFDKWRSTIVCEPRGASWMVGALLLPPHDPTACSGVIFFNNVGYLGMCGHGTIGVIETLAHLGRISPGKHRLETPVGTVGTELHADGRVSIDNVESYRHAARVPLHVPGYGGIHGDVAWGGNWFFITENTPIALDSRHLKELTVYSEAVRHALKANGVTGKDGAEIDHVEISTRSPTSGMNSRNFVLCPGLEYDRSPCGTGTSAKLACLAADGTLAAHEVWHQEGILGSAFEGSYTPGDLGVMPKIVGRAHITASTTLLVAEADPFAWGICL